MREVWLLDPAKRTIEVFAGTARLKPIGGRINAPSLSLVLRIAGSTLHIDDDGQDHVVNIRGTL